jgi:GWxTD domain-containing protein
MTEPRRSGALKGKFRLIYPDMALAFALLLLVPSLAGTTKGDLPAAQKKWLEEEAVYIIAPLEREVFLKLKTERERDLFIEAFWKHRDPTPGTPENEFKIEHYRRINYANHFFGRGSPGPGWRTDRGRVYIILCEPTDIERFEGKAQVYPVEVWFYQGRTEFGLPPGFNIVFFRPGNVGEYRLYSPGKDGPQALLTSYYGDPVDYMAAYFQLKEFEPALAEVSLSLIPGEESGTLGRPSLSSDFLIQNVETAAQRAVEDKYARRFLEYKDIVEVEYSANYIDCDGLVKLIRDPAGLYFVHFSIEPQRLSVGQYEGKYFTSLIMNGSVTTPGGKIIHQFDRTMSMNFTEEKMSSFNRQPLSIHEMFPLIPGEYRFSVLVKNEVSKEFTSLERTLSIPGVEPTIQMTSPILAYKAVPVEPNQQNLKPFRFAHYQVYAQPNRAFCTRDTLFVAFQVLGLSPEIRNRAELRFLVLKDDVEFRELTKKLIAEVNLPDVLEQFPLSDFPPAHYSLRISLIIDRQEVTSAKDEFDLTHLKAISRPWVYSRILPPRTDPVYDFIVGGELLNKGQLKEAIARLKNAQGMRPDSAEYALSLAQAYMAAGNYSGIEPLLLPFLDVGNPARYEFYFLLGQAWQKLGEWDKAIALFDKAISNFGTNINILNALAECYLQKGRTKEALAIWEKSLELNREQPEILKAVQALREKK